MSRQVQRLLWLPAFALSGGAQALGLGDLHVTSALNEPLTGQIDIVGASPEDLSDIRAAVANHDTFMRYGAERPGFLGTANFKVGKDKAGRPVLLIHSTEAFTEPLVSLLVDMRWSRGELVREYTLLLDPAISASSASRAADSAPELPRAAPAQIETARTAVAPIESARAAPAMAAAAVSYVVAHRDTLGAIARRTGANTETDLYKTMVAIFHANPNAFIGGNINRLRIGASLIIPASAIIEAIPAKAASLEVHAQMLAWRATAGIPAVVARAEPSPSTAAVAALEQRAADVQRIQELADRIETLQRGLDDLKRQQDQHPAAAQAPNTPQALSAAPSVSEAASASTPPNTEAAQAADAEAAPVASDPAADLPPPKTHGGLIAGAWALFAAGLAFAYRRNRRRAEEEAMAALDDEPEARDTRFKPLARQAEHESFAPVETQSIYTLPPRAPAPLDGNAGIESILDGDTAPHRTMLSDERAARDEERSGETTVTVALTGIRSYDVTLEMPVQQMPVQEMPEQRDTDETVMSHLEHSETHVDLPSGLNEQVPFKERRMNVVDVLRNAIEREPDRMDLRIKLIEVYHSMTAVNRQGFIDAARKLAEQPNYQSTPEWEKIAAMGRQIAPEEPLFALDPTVEHQKIDEKFANCA